MTLLFAMTVAVVFGAGAWLLLKPDLFRVVGGLALISNAAVLMLIASGLRRGQAPIEPLTGDEPPSDPLVQAMALTAIVIGFAVTALLLVLVLRIYRTHRSVDLDDLSRMEASSEEDADHEDAEAEEPEDEEPEGEAEREEIPA